MLHLINAHPQELLPQAKTAIGIPPQRKALIDRLEEKLTGTELKLQELLNQARRKQAEDSLEAMLGKGVWLGNLRGDKREGGPEALRSEQRDDELELPQYTPAGQEFRLPASHKEKVARLVAKLKSMEARQGSMENTLPSEKKRSVETFMPPVQEMDDVPEQTSVKHHQVTTVPVEIHPFFNKAEQSFDSIRQFKKNKIQEKRGSQISLASMPDMTPFTHSMEMIHLSEAGPRLSGAKDPSLYDYNEVELSESDLKEIRRLEGMLKKGRAGLQILLKEERRRENEHTADERFKKRSEELSKIFWDVIGWANARILGIRQGKPIGRISETNMHGLLKATTSEAVKSRGVPNRFKRVKFTVEGQGGSQIVFPYKSKSPFKQPIRRTQSVDL